MLFESNCATTQRVPFFLMHVGRPHSTKPLLKRIDSRC